MTIAGREVRLTGFGSARISSEGTIYYDPTTLDVDRRYIAPEVMDPALGDVDVEADLFGLAATAFALFDGRPPWTESWRAQVDPVEWPDRMPEAVWSVLAPMLEARPRDRTTSLEALREAVKAIRPALQLGGQSGSSGGPSVESAPLEYVEGDLIDDRYLVRSQLGSGSFSTAYHVHDTVRDEDLALKLFHKSHGLSAVQRELQALVHIRHPNVVEVVDAGQTSTFPRQWYIKSRLALGTSIADYTQTANLLPPDEAARVVGQILQACRSFHPDSGRIARLAARSDDRELTDAERATLDRLTSAGIVHRDIKPENIVYDRASGRALLLDFNVASFMDQPESTVGGTLRYRPPEADLPRWSATWDLFAVGILLFELLTGEHPYEDGDPSSGSVRTLSSVRPDLPDGLERVCAKACSTREDERYVSASQMHDALVEAVPDAFRPPSHGAPADGARTLNDVTIDGASAGGSTQSQGGEGRPILELTVDGEHVELAVTPDPSTDGSRQVFSASTLDGRTYAAPHGARVWLPGPRPLRFDDAVRGAWVLLLPGPAGSPVPVLLDESAASGFRLRSDSPLVLEGTAFTVRVEVEDRQGDALVAITCLAESTLSSQSPSTDIAGKSEGASTQPDSLVPKEVESFIHTRAGGDSLKEAATLAYVRMALALGDIAPSFGSSVKTADGLTDYLMLHSRPTRRTGALAYVKPRLGVVDLRLPEEAAAGRKHTEVLSPGHRAYRVRLHLGSAESLAEGRALLEQAVQLQDEPSAYGRGLVPPPEPSVGHEVPTDASPPDMSNSPTRPDRLGHRAARRSPMASHAADSHSPSADGDLEGRFHDHLTQLVRSTIKQTDYKPALFMRMLQERGGLRTAQYLLAAPTASSGFTTLWEMQRLDLTLEAVVLDPAWCDLFSERELSVARDRLSKHGYHPT